jgi:hypothetical protein
MAAQKCRVKKKVILDDLQNRFNFLAKMNDEMALEERRLREEIVNIKAILVSCQVILYSFRACHRCIQFLSTS